MIARYNISLVALTAVHNLDCRVDGGGGVDAGVSGTEHISTTFHLFVCWTSKLIQLKGRYGHGVYCKSCVDSKGR